MPIGFHVEYIIKKESTIALILEIIVIIYQDLCWDLWIFIVYNAWEFLRLLTISQPTFINRRLAVPVLENTYIRGNGLHPLISNKPKMLQLVLSCVLRIMINELNNVIKVNFEYIAMSSLQISLDLLYWLYQKFFTIFISRTVA